MKYVSIHPPKTVLWIVAWKVKGVTKYTGLSLPTRSCRQQSRVLSQGKEHLDVPREIQQPKAIRSSNSNILSETYIRHTVSGTEKKRGTLIWLHPLWLTGAKLLSLFWKSSPEFCDFCRCIVYRQCQNYVWSYLNVQERWGCKAKLSGVLDFWSSWGRKMLHLAACMVTCAPNNFIVLAFEYF